MNTYRESLSASLSINGDGAGVLSVCFTNRVLTHLLYPQRRYRCGIDVLHLYPIALFMSKHIYGVASLEHYSCECLSHEVANQFY